MRLDAWLQLIERMKRALIAAQAERPRRSDWSGGEPAWVGFERDTMLNAVNFYRTTNGLPPVTLDDVKRAEAGALGHSDYTHKFALYCAELARGGKVGA